MAACHLAAWHVLLAARLFSGAAAHRRLLKVFAQAENDTLSVFDPALSRFTPVELQHGALEQQRSF